MLNRVLFLRISSAFVILAIATFSFISTVYLPEQLLIGYGIVYPSSGNLPVALTLHCDRDSEGILTSESEVGCVKPIHRGRIFVDEFKSIGNALAIVNPSTNPISLTFVLRDSSGSELENTTEQFQTGQVPLRIHYIKFLVLNLRENWSRSEYTV